MENDYVEWASVAAAVFAGIGLLLTAIQIARASRQQRVERVSEFAKDIFDDPELRGIYYQLEYGQFEYGDSFHGSEEEQHLDKLLGRFDSLARQVEMGVLKLKDLDIIAYEYIVAYQDLGVASYFEFLDGWFRTRGLKREPYKAFRDIGAKVERRMYQS
ncbi:MAG: hypothetical protein AAGI91_10120 [Bacteroidota bacterium]